MGICTYELTNARQMPGGGEEWSRLELTEPLGFFRLKEERKSKRGYTLYIL